jgi:hypothetical protein
MVNRDAEGERRDKRDLMPRLSISSRHISRIAISAGGTKMGSATVCRLPSPPEPFFVAFSTSQIMGLHPKDR